MKQNTDKIIPDYIPALWEARRYLKSRRKMEQNKGKTADEKKITELTKYIAAIGLALRRLDPNVPPSQRTSAYRKHRGNTKRYSITLSPEEHDIFVAFGKEAHITGGFSGVLSYIAQNIAIDREI